MLLISCTYIHSLIWQILPMYLISSYYVPGCDLYYKNGWWNFPVQVTIMSCLVYYTNFSCVLPGSSIAFPFTTVMINSVCQLDSAMGCPEIWSNIILVFLRGCFWIRLIFKSVDGVVQISLPRWVSFIQSVGDLNRTSRLRLLSRRIQVKENSSCLTAFGLKPHHWLSWFSGFWTWTRNTSPAFLFADNRLCDFLASVIPWAHFL